MADVFCILPTPLLTLQPHRIRLEGDMQYRIRRGLGSGLQANDELAQSDFLLREFDLGNDE